MNTKTNLLEETEQALANHHLTFKNVKFIQNKEGTIPVADFIRSAQSIDYEDGYGNVCIDPTLKIVGACWWFERANYDGNEGWIFCKKPQPSTLSACDFNLLEERSFGESDILSRIEKSAEKKVN